MALTKEQIEWATKKINKEIKLFFENNVEFQKLKNEVLEAQEKLELQQKEIRKKSKEITRLENKYKK